MQDWFVRLEYFVAKTLNLVAIVAALCAYNAWATKATAHDAAVRAQIAQAEQAARRGPYVTDGTFEGTAHGYRGEVAVSVAIDDGHITRVDIVDAGQEDSAFLAVCEGLPARVVEAQSTDVDVVSGATFTSRGIATFSSKAILEAYAHAVSQAW